MRNAKNYDSIDLLKAILSVFVVVIHINPLGGGISNIVFPLVRIAVPLFFMISGYFFFIKLYEYPQHGSTFLLRFVKRNLQLYLFWFCVLLPFTLYKRQYFTYSLLRGISQIILDFLFSSTFNGSWYLIALVEGVCIIFLVRKFLSTKTLLFITGFIQLICCLACNYRGLFSESGNFLRVVSLYPEGNIYNSFFVGLWWITLGKYFAEKKNGIVEVKSKFLILISIVLLYIEQMLIYYLDCSYANDVYLLLSPAAILIFCYSINCTMKIKHAEILRMFSIITYCSHITLRSVYGSIIRLVFSKEENILVFSLTLITCLVLTIVINRLERIRFFSWLRFSH